MRTLWETSPSSSSGEETEDLAPTQLLSMAIKKRRALYESKDRDFRKELLHTGIIQTLCKFLGEGRACRKNKRASRKRKLQNSQDRNKPVDLPKAYAISNADLEPMDDAKPDPTMLELNGTDDEDAVVPSVTHKRPKYEQVFAPETEPTEQEKEIIKEYVFEDFMSSFVSFYTPNEYYSSSSNLGDGGSVEPTKDLYWCCIDSDSSNEDEENTLDWVEPPLFYGGAPPHDNNNPFEFLALCS